MDKITSKVHTSTNGASYRINVPKIVRTTMGLDVKDKLVWNLIPDGDNFILRVEKDE